MRRAKPTFQHYVSSTLRAHSRVLLPPLNALSQSFTLYTRPNKLNHRYIHEAAFVNVSPFGVENNLPAQSEDGLQLQGLLARAQRYGISSVEQLQFQTSFRDPALRGQLLIDNDTLRPDLGLWAVLTDFTIYQKGTDGARDTLYALTHRGSAIPLNDDGEITTSVWQKLLVSAAHSGQLDLVQVLIQKLAWDRRRLWPEVVGAFLSAGHWQVAQIISQRLRNKHYRGFESVRDLYNICQPSSVKHFIQFFSLVNADYHLKGLYREVIPELLREERYDDAFMLHDFLISRGDLPPTFAFIEPLIYELAVQESSAEAFLRKLAAAGVSFSSQARRAYESARANPIRKDERALHFSPKATSDAWIARAFATRSLSPHFVMNTLRVFNVSELGPQAIRELGLAAGNSGAFGKYLTRLNDLGIDTGSSAYVRVLRKLCHDKEERMLHQVLQTSIHHDVFEDENMLKRLVLENFVAQNWTEVNLLLAVLNGGDLKTHPADKYICEIILNLPFDKENQRTMLGVLSIWLSRDDIPFAEIERLISGLVASCLYVAPSQPGRTKLNPKERFPAEMLRRAHFIAGIMQEAMKNGTHLPVNYWRPILRYLDEAGLVDQFIFLSTWLADWYAPTSLGESLTSSMKSKNIGLNHLFNERYQSNLMHLALRGSLKMSKRYLVLEDDWSRALRLLQLLKARYGVVIHLNILSRAANQRIRRRLRHIAGRSLAFEHRTRRTDPAPVLARINAEIDRALKD